MSSDRVWIEESHFNHPSWKRSTEKGDLNQHTNMNHGFYGYVPDVSGT